jgi:hypothetical protein
MALKLNKAVYDPRGFMTLAWDSARIDRSPGFLVNIRMDGGYGNFSILDPRATSVILPFDGAPDGAKATLWALLESYNVDTRQQSNTVDVGTIGSPGAGPVDPMPTSPLSIGGASSITFDARRLLSTVPANVSWRAAPDDNVSADHGSAPVADGSATIRVNVTSKLSKPYASLLTISVGDADQPDGDRAAVLYNIVKPRLTTSQNRTYGVVCDPDNYPFDIKNKDQTIALTALVRDADDGKPIPNYRLGWKSNSGVAPIVRYPDGGTPVARDDGTYITYTDVEGSLTLLFAGPRPSIGEMGVYWINDNNVRQHMLAFTSMGTGWEMADMEAPDVPTPLHLDRYADDKGVPVYLINQHEPWMKRGAFAAYWINGVMLEPERLGDDFLTAPTMIPKQYFKTDGENLLGVCIADPAGSNGNDSRLADFFADGKIPAEQPHKPSGGFDAPFLNAYADLVNTPLISGGLRVNVPPSKNLSSGDTVTLTLYLDAWFAGTDAPKSATIHVADSRVVGGNDVADGFFLVASEALLANYAANTKGVPGTMQAQYKVTGKGGVESYSDVGKFRLATV